MSFRMNLVPTSFPHSVLATLTTVWADHLVSSYGLRPERISSTGELFRFRMSVDILKCTEITMQVELCAGFKLQIVKEELVVTSLY